MTKRMRLPNGFGQISKINRKNLRNPYRAMITVGKTDKGRPICKLLKPKAYFRTYNEAYEALVEYNRNPYDLSDLITLEELYDRWSKEYYNSNLSDSTKKGMIWGWNNCKTLYKTQVTEIRSRHIKACIDAAESNNLKARIKMLFNMLFDYAVEYELVEKNYARMFNFRKIEEVKKEKHINFTDDEMKILWANVDKPFVDILLIQCYMGWRPQELGEIKISNVDLENRTIMGGMKTKAGTDRIVPIHDCIFDLVKKRYQMAVTRGVDHLFFLEDQNNDKMRYDKYRYRFVKLIDNLNLNPLHKPHDPRVHFVTICKKYNVDEYAIKYMVGHTIQDLTEDVYTRRDSSWLNEELSKIKV